MQLTALVALGALNLSRLVGGMRLGQRAGFPISGEQHSAPDECNAACRPLGSWRLPPRHRPGAATLPQAKAQCSNAYVINPGTNGGVMMHVADSSELFDLQLRAGPDGKTYLGPEGKPAGSRVGSRNSVHMKRARRITTARWVDPEVMERYGTMVFVRCK